MQRIEIVQDYTLPVERVYAYLADHDNLGRIFGAKITRLREGETTRDGVGSVRQLKIGPLPPFEETVTEAVPDRLIVYRITKGGVLRDHSGRLEFEPTATGTRLTYVMVFRGVVPGLDRLIKPGLERSMRRGLPKVQTQA